MQLEEKKIPYVVQKENMRCYGPKTREYLGLTPSGLLPALELDGRFLTESSAIMDLLERGGYDYVAPSSVSYLASVGYSLRADVVSRACDIKTTDDTEMMWYHVDRVPELRTIELPVPEARIRNVRLTLDYEEDYWLLRTVLRLLGPGATMAEIEDLFLRNPDLAEVNWFRNAAWKAGQEFKRI